MDEMDEKLQRYMDVPAFSMADQMNHPINELFGFTDKREDYFYVCKDNLDSDVDYLNLYQDEEDQDTDLLGDKVPFEEEPFISKNCSAAKNQTEVTLTSVFGGDTGTEETSKIVQTSPTNSIQTLKDIHIQNNNSAKARRRSSVSSVLNKFLCGCGVTKKDQIESRKRFKQTKSSKQLKLNKPNKKSHQNISLTPEEPEEPTSECENVSNNENIYESTTIIKNYPIKAQVSGTSSLIDDTLDDLNTWGSSKHNRSKRLSIVSDRESKILESGHYAKQKYGVTALITSDTSISLNMTQTAYSKSQKTQKSSEYEVQTAVPIRNNQYYKKSPSEVDFVGMAIVPSGKRDMALKEHLLSRIDYYNSTTQNHLTAKLQTQT